MRQLRVRFLAPANADIKAIYDWICDSSGYSQVAETFIGRIIDRCEQLSMFPHSGIERSDLAPGLRLLSFEKKAAIFYRVEYDEVQIVSVLYGGRDYDSSTFHG